MAVGSRDLLTQALPILLLTAVGGTLAGGVLSTMEAALRAIPALIVVAPALISLRGTINGALGARLGTAVHMGLVGGDAGRREVLENVTASLLLSLVTSFAAAAFGYGATVAFGHDAGSFGVLATVSVAAGFTGGLLLAGLTVATVLVAHRRGLDPDNVTSPVLATVGDLVTLVLLFVFAGILVGGSVP